MEENVDSVVKRLLNKLSGDKKIFIDNLRKDLGVGYASDTNVYLCILGFDYYKKGNKLSEGWHKRRNNLLEWYRNTSQVIYSIQLYEILSVLEKEKKWIEIKESERNYYSKIKKMERMEKNLTNLLNSPRVRLVLNETDDFKRDPVLYETLLKEFGGISYDMEIAIYSSYEKVPLLSYDGKMEEILFRNNLPFIDTFKPLPYNYTQEWRELIK